MLTAEDAGLPTWQVILYSALYFLGVLTIMVLLSRADRRQQRRRAVVGSPRLRPWVAFLLLHSLPAPVSAIPTASAPRSAPTRLPAVDEPPEPSPPKTESRGHVFISYNHNDFSYVEKLAKHLDSHGIRAWYDYHLVAGERFASVIQEQIYSCSAFIVVVTPDAMASKWVKLEIDYAHYRNKPFFPLKRAESELYLVLVGAHHEDVTSAQMPTAAFIARLRHLTAQ